MPGAMPLDHARVRAWGTCEATIGAPGGDTARDRRSRNGQPGVPCGEDRTRSRFAATRYGNMDSVVCRNHSYFTTQDPTTTPGEGRMATRTFGLDRNAPRSLCRQVYEGVRAAILRRHVAPGGRLPSTQTVARNLGIARYTHADVHRACSVPCLAHPFDMSGGVMQPPLCARPGTGQMAHATMRFSIGVSSIGFP